MWIILCLVSVVWYIFFAGMCESVGYWTKQWKKPNINARMFGKLRSKVLKKSFIFEGAWFNFLSSFFLKLPLRKCTVFFFLVYDFTFLTWKAPIISLIVSGRHPAQYLYHYQWHFMVQIFWYFNYRYTYKYFSELFVTWMHKLYSIGIHTMYK